MCVCVFVCVLPASRCAYSKRMRLLWLALGLPGWVLKVCATCNHLTLLHYMQRGCRYMSLNPTKDLQPSTQVFPKARTARTGVPTQEDLRLLAEHDAAGEKAYQEWMASKGEAYARKRARQARSGAGLLILCTTA